MLASDAVDRSVAQIDLTPLRGKKVFFDTQYIRSVKGAGFVNADYIISSLRQQMFAHDCRIQDNREDAEIVIEGRVGVLGIDDHEITYGMPASNALNSAASAAGAQIPLPALPELSVAKKNEQIGASKVALFAYDRETRERVWQSGVTTSMSDSDAFWVFGAGPFRRGSIYQGMHLAGSRMPLPHREDTNGAKQDVALARYQKEDDFSEADEPAPIIAPEDAARIRKPSEQGTPATLSIADEPTPAPASSSPSTSETAKPEPEPEPAPSPVADESAQAAPEAKPQAATEAKPPAAPQSALQAASNAESKPAEAKAPPPAAESPAAK